VADLSLVEAANQAFVEEMRRDPRVVLLGEDVRIGLYGFTAGLVEEFGERRIVDTPISEAGFSGLAIGAAIGGLRPVVDLMISSFMYLAMDQIINNAAKMRYMSGGKVGIPMVFWALTGARGSTGGQHADAAYGLLLNVPGLKVVVPSTPSDVKGLLKAAIRDDDPVLFFQPVGLGRQRGEVPDGDHVVPLGRANILRPGTDVTVVACGAMVPRAMKVADQLGREGISVEVVDLRTVIPLDRSTIVQSVRKTGRLVAVDETHVTGGVASEILATVTDALSGEMRFRGTRVGALDTPIPFSPPLEKTVIPDEARIETAIRQMLA
jgi:pyruvate dehydrogenase E1 component beta subunit